MKRWAFSLYLNFLKSDISQLFNPGPRTVFGPESLWMLPFRAGAKYLLACGSAKERAEPCQARNIVNIVERKSLSPVEVQDAIAGTACIGEMAACGSRRRGIAAGRIRQTESF